MPVSNFRIQILSVSDLAEHIDKYAGKHLASIRDPNRCRNEYNTIDRKGNTFGSMIVLKMSDVWLPEHERMGYQLPREEQIKELLNWSKGKHDFVVHCTAGVSRSSAIAYVLACCFMPPSEAISVLDPYKHDPNDLIVQLGAKLLGNPEVLSELKRFGKIAKIASTGGILISPPKSHDLESPPALMPFGSGAIFPSR